MRVAGIVRTTVLLVVAVVIIAACGASGGHPARPAAAHVSTTTQPDPLAQAGTQLQQANDDLSSNGADPMQTKTLEGSTP